VGQELNMANVSRRGESPSFILTIGNVVNESS
jgi:hypothetical protein